MWNQSRFLVAIAITNNISQKGVVRLTTEISAANTFTIKTDKPNVKVSWLVTGVRQDAYANAHRIVGVMNKTGDEKGKYIHPELFGQAKEKGIFYKPVSKQVDIDNTKR